MPRSPMLDEIEYREPKTPKVKQSKTTYSEPWEWRIPPIARYLRPVLAGLLLFGLLAGIVVGMGSLISHLRNTGGDSSLSSPPAAAPPPAPTSIQTTFTLTTEPDDLKKGMVRIEPEETSYRQNAKVKLTAEPAPGYKFDKWTGDLDEPSTPSSLAIDVTMDRNKHVIAHFKCEDTIAPIISQVKTRKYSDVSATIEWTTNEPTTCTVRYRQEHTDIYSEPIPSRTTDHLTHTARIPGLKPLTSYYARIEATNQCGNPADAKIHMFNTQSKIYEGHQVGTRARNLVLVPYQGGNRDWIKDLHLNDNGEFELSQFLPKDGQEGRKIFLDFWSTYCGACIYEFAWIRDVHEKSIEVKKADPTRLTGDLAEYAYLKDWEIVTVCIDVYEDRLATREDRIQNTNRRFRSLEEKYSEDLKGGPLQPTFIYAPTADQKAYPVWTLPMHVFIDEDGIIRKIDMQRFIRPGQIKQIMDSI